MVCSFEDRNGLRNGNEMQLPVGPARGEDAVNVTPLLRHVSMVSSEPN
jgi:hypothetical protein